MLAYAGVCSRMLAYAHVRSRMLAGGCVLAVAEGLLAEVDPLLPRFAGVPEAQNSLSSDRHFDICMRLERSAQRKKKEVPTLRCCFCSKAVAVVFVAKPRCTYRGLSSTEREREAGGGVQHNLPLAVFKVSFLAIGCT